MKVKCDAAASGLCNNTLCHHFKAHKRMGACAQERYYCRMVHEVVMCIPHKEVPFDTTTYTIIEELVDGGEAVRYNYTTDKLSKAKAKATRSTQYINTALRILLGDKTISKRHGIYDSKWEDVEE